MPRKRRARPRESTCVQSCRGRSRSEPASAMGGVTGTTRRSEAGARDAVGSAEETMGRPARGYRGRVGHPAVADVIEVGIIVIGKWVVVPEADPSAVPAGATVLHCRLAGLSVERGG